MDLPNLNDARRVARLTMIFDELVHAGEDLPVLSALDFKMCGGALSKIKNKKYSFYRQLVYATRDLKGYVRRGAFPSCDAVHKAKELFYFHPSSVEKHEVDDTLMKTHDHNRVLRMLIVLQKVRKSLNSTSTHMDITKIRESQYLNEDEFLKCGCKKRYKKTLTNLDTQLRYILADLRHIFERGRLYPPCVLLKAQREIHLEKEYDWNAYIDTTDEEDVDNLDEIEKA